MERPTVKPLFRLLDPERPWRHISTVLWILVLALVFLFGVLLVAGSGRFEVTRHSLEAEGLTAPLTIMHLSDVHGEAGAPGGQDLVSVVSEERPNLILLSGDLLSKRRNAVASAAEILSALGRIAPVYVSRGNHDLQAAQWSELTQRTSGSRVTYLVNELIAAQVGEQTITLAGVDDFAAFDEDRARFAEALYALSRGAGGTGVLSILLSHRPEHADLYADLAFDLILAGHAHGGQIRLPGIGALWAPDQGLFPRYTSGLHALRDATLVISRGTGPSSFPVRVNNRPEVVVLTLHP